MKKINKRIIYKLLQFVLLLLLSSYLITLFFKKGISKYKHFFLLKYHVFFYFVYRFTQEQKSNLDMLLVELKELFIETKTMS